MPGAKCRGANHFGAFFLNGAGDEKETMIRPKVRICSLVSNEALYLPQWIHHHNYFGFDGFDLFVNRTTDNTVAVLNKLKLLYPGISVHNAEWVDKYFNNVPPWGALQYISNLQNYLDRGPECDYILNMDIDEFWLSRNCRDTIQDCIVKFGLPDCIAFEWYVIGGENEYIMLLFAKRNFFGKMNRWVKTATKTGLPLRMVNNHFPLFEVKGNLMCGDGKPLKCNRGDPYRLHADQGGKAIPEYFIVHDAIRSPINNLAKFAKGSPIKKFATIEERVNKRYFYFEMQSASGLLPFKNSLDPDYYAGFRKLMNHLDLFPDIRVAEIDELLYALSFLRQAHNLENQALLNKISEKFGNIKPLWQNIFSRLVSLDASFLQYAPFAFANITSLQTDDKEKTISNFIAATELYPYESDARHNPLFMAKLLELLTQWGDFTRARTLIENPDSRALKKFGVNWALPILAKAYHEHGYYSNALELYKMMEFSRDKNIYAEIDKLEKVVAGS